MSELRAVALSGEKLSLDALWEAVAHAGAGAVVTFAGTVRDFNEGHAVTLLEYEAYETMAVAVMARIVRELEVEIPGVRVAVHHRSGPLGVGDVAVICAASAPHRGEAFRACRAAIDRVKAEVPIWKREHGPEGPYWVGWQDARCSGEEHHHAEHQHAEHDHGGEHHHAEHERHADRHRSGGG
ncbi:MAG TPA: molybdenum cofactor biosynthesis protein MoaE [Polyangiaceae bacterium]|nr:molybdenum cofactor biosynthesis protein MoaE [Polyangiaceae bacterium]